MTLKSYFHDGELYLYLNNRHIPAARSNDSDISLGCDFLVEGSHLCTFDDIADVLAGDLPEHCCISVRLESSEYAHLDGVSFAKKDGDILIEVHLYYDISGWDGHINITKIVAAMVDRLVAANWDVGEPVSEEGIIILSFTKTVDSARTLREETAVVDTFLVRAHREVSNNFDLLPGVLTKLSIPQEYRHVFCQYLAYFGQFLADMGIPAETTVASRGDHILLSVKPRDKDEAMQNIYLALASYLALPDGDPLVTPAKDALAQVRYQQLMANVEHFKAQLALTRAIVEVKNEQISLLQAAELERMRLALSVIEKPGVVPERWELMEGLALTTYKGPFFEIDIPRLIRRLTGKN